MSDGPAAGTSHTVVVANPDETVCEVLARLVERAGYSAVRSSEPGQAAAAVLSAAADAVVLDLAADTVEQLRALRGGGSQRGFDARAIVIATGPANALLAWQADADAVLTRPFKAEALEAALADALAADAGTRAAVRADAVRSLS